MSRPVGSKNKDFEASRLALLNKLEAVLHDMQKGRISFRELAQVAEVTPATLRHYFGTREQTLAATMIHAAVHGTPHTDLAAHFDVEGARASLLWFLHFFLEGWQQHGVNEILGFGLIASMGRDDLGPVYAMKMLEPLLQAGEARIQRHIERNEIAPCDVRSASLQLISPVLLALIHQDALFGKTCRPLDIAAFVEEQVDFFLRGHAPVSSASDSPKVARRNK